MKVLPHHIFINHPPYLKWLEDVVDYISAHATGSTLFALVKEVAQEWLDKQDPDSQKRYLHRAYAYPERFVSNDFFAALTFKQGKGKGADGGIPMGVVDAACDLLVIKGILYKQTTIRPGGDGFQNEQEYQVDQNLVKYLMDNGLMYNHLFGFNHIIDRYTSSVVKIEVRHGEDISLGTGWYLDIFSSKDPALRRRLVITNEHVIAGSSSFRVVSKDEVTLSHQKFELMMEKTGADIALIQLDSPSEAPAFHFNTAAQLLEEVITIGYPFVPLSRDAYQVVHRGEVNANVTDIMGQDLVIISARTSPGHSGSPVLDDTGRVVGMVTKELFEKSAFEQKGITPYFACLPAKTIIAAVEKSDLFIEFD